MSSLVTAWLVLVLLLSGCYHPHANKPLSHLESDAKAARDEITYRWRELNVVSNSVWKEWSSNSFSVLTQKVNAAREQAYPERQRRMDAQRELEIFIRRIRGLDAELKVYRSGAGL